MVRRIVFSDLGAGNYCCFSSSKTLVQLLTGRNRMDAAKALKIHGIYGSSALGAFICANEKCRCVIRTDEESFKSHCRMSPHKMNSGECEELWKSAVEVQMKEMKVQSVLREQYMKGGVNSGPLPMILGLDTFRVKGCPFCGRLFKTNSALWNHGKEQHPGNKLGRNEWKSLQWMYAQGMSRKRGCENLFLVKDSDVSRNDGSLGTVANKPNWSSIIREYDHFNSYTKNSRSTEGEEEDGYKSGFMMLSKPDALLRDLGMSKEDALDLTSFPDSGKEPRLYAMSRRLHESTLSIFVDAQKEYSRGGRFASDLMEVASSGSMEKRTPFRFLDQGEEGRSSRDRYARSARIILFIACRVFLAPEKYRGIRMSAKLASRVRCLVECSTDEEEEKLQEVVHQVYTEVFFERAVSMNREGIQLFASVVLASLCVRKGERGEGQFRIGVEVSPYIVGITYTASCCALLQLYRYWRLRLESGESENVLREKERARVVDAMKFGARAGISIFIDMRAVCSRLRDEETNAPEYIVCPDHSKCGIFLGIEYSVKSLGESVRRMQKDTRNLILDSLLFGLELPTDFEAVSSTLRDDETNTTEGYWFMTDVRNTKFVRQCQNWMADKVGSRMESSRIEAWVKTAKEVHRRLICLLHLTGGGPARGTEIARMTIRNTKRTRRALFFSGKEVIVFPTHNKTRVIRGGRMRKIFRYLDEETSFLFKTFFLVVHPTMVTVMDTLNKDEENYNASDTFKMQYRLCMGMKFEERLSEEISSWFARYNIPYKFSEYRHWQRGYIKSNTSMSAAATLEMLESNSLNDEEGKLLDGLNSAAILQAGHGIRTAYTAYAALQPSGARSSKEAEEWKSLQRRASIDWHEELGLIHKKPGVVSKPERGLHSPELMAPSAKDLASTVSRLEQRLADVTKQRDEAIKERDELKLTISLLQSGADENDAVANISTIGDAERSMLNCHETILSEFCEIDALKRVLNNRDAEFRHPMQKQAMSCIAARRTDIAVILRTGFGKTAIVCGPILYEHGLTIWVSPLRALLQETSQRLQKSGIQVWRVEDEQVWQLENSVGNVLLISPETIERRPVIELAKRCSGRGHLNRIVYDEAHIPFMSRGYRECMGMLRGLADVGCEVQRVMVSATIPPALVPNISNVFGVASETLEVIRGDPCRPNLTLSVRQLSDGSESQLKRVTTATVMRFILRAKNDPGAFPMRVMVICLTMKHADQVHATLQNNKRDFVTVCKYHSKMSEEDTALSVRLWAKGLENGVVVMVATDGFSTGTDVPNIRQVVFAGGSRSLIDYWQGAGRGGRDGKPCHVEVLYHRAHLAHSMAERDALFGNRAVLGDFREWAESSSSCRRQRVEQFLGSMREYGSCLERVEQKTNEKVELCDVCIMLGNVGNIRATTPAEYFPATAEKRKKISSGDLEAGKRQRRESVRIREEKTERIRRLASNLKELCVWCLVEGRSLHLEQGAAEFVTIDINSAKRCFTRGRGCFRARDRCVRCHQIGHRAGGCTVLRSTKSTPGKACCVCFAKYVDGRAIHMANEYGNKIGCPFGVITQFAMTCYSVPKIRSAMAREYPRISNSNAKEVAEWILEDKDSRSPATLFDVAIWGVKLLKVERLC